MAQKRMFDKSIIDSDNFLDMPLSSQALYFHLNMRADDEGFINNPRRIMRMIGINDDDLKLLITKNFIIPFESGVIVIKHWRLNNYLDKNKVKSTNNLKEKKELIIDENNEYEMVRLTEAKPKFTESLPSIEENRIEENRIEENNIKSELDNSVNLLKETYSKYFKTISKKFTTKKVKDKVEKILKENKVDFNCVVKGLDNYLKSCVDEKDRLTNDITYIRNCERFLNEELWNDFLEDIDYSKQKKLGVKTIGSTESWNKVEERELTEEEQKDMEDIIKKMKGEK